MSNIHEGVSCDICMKSNFTGKRYKCLICYDFDLCETCHEKFTSAKNSAGVAATSTTAPKMTNTNHNHQETHPMQCILTRNDYELYYGTGGGGSGAAAAAGVLIDYGEQLSFTCPYCGRLGFSESALCEHLSQFHLGGNQAEQQNLSQEVVCPICAVLPSSSGGDPNHLTDDLLHHIQLEHMNSPSDPLTLNSGLIGSSSGAAARFSRRLNYAAAAAAAANLSRSSNSTGTSNFLLSSGAGAAATVARNHLSGSTSNRFGFQLSGAGAGIGQPGTSAGLSSFIRSATTAMETLGAGSSSSGVNSASDPIVELLSQLTGVRRANVQSTNIQLQQLQAQLTRERESLQQQASAAAALAASAASAAAPLSSSTTSTRHHHYSSATGANASPSQHHHHHHSSHLFPSSGGSNILSNKLLSSSKMSNPASSSNAGVNNNQTAGGANGNQNSSVTNLTNALINQILELPNVSFLQQLPSNVRDPRFLLSKYDFSNMESSPQPTPLPSVSGNTSSSTLPPPPTTTTISNNSKLSSLNIISQSIFVNELLLALIVGNVRINDSQNSAPIQATAAPALEASTVGESSTRKKQVVPALTSASAESMTAALLCQESTSTSTNESNLVVAENEQILEELLREQCVVTANNSQQQQQQSATNI